jgi:hypothetical protein
MLMIGAVGGVAWAPAAGAEEPAVWTPPAHPARPVLNVDFKTIVAPVGGPFASGNDFGAPRNGGRQHQGNDLFGAKMEHLVATVNGTISYLRTDAGGLSGNMLILTGGDGWMYVYMHLNNDTPGTDDGSNHIDRMLAPGIGLGSYVRAGQFIAFMGDSGNAEDLQPHVHFEIRRPNNTPIDPYISVRKAQKRSWLDRGSNVPVAAASVATPVCASVDQSLGPEKRRGGYFALGTDGGVFNFGDAAPATGSVAGVRLNKPPIAIATTPDAKGYWIAAADGGVFSFGDAQNFGSMATQRLNAPVVGIAATPTGNGYWLAARDGGVFAFGDAQPLGSLAATRLNGGVVGIAASPTGNGYWLAASDGGVFNFGDAQYNGGAVGLHLPVPIADIAATPSGHGYWLIGSDGGVFAFGDAPYQGSLPGLGLCDKPRAVAIAASPTGKGYWVASADGRTWPFGDAPRVGSVANLHLPGSPGIVALALAKPAPVAGTVPEHSVVVECVGGGTGGCPAATIADMFTADWLKDLDNFGD